MQGLPLDLTGRTACAREALRVARVHHTRFLIPALVVDQCSQEEWKQLCTLPGLLSLTVKGTAQGSALVSLPQSRSITSLRLLERAGASVHDLSHAAQCTALETLVLHSCAVTDVAPLAAAPRLRCLELRKATALTGVAPLCAGAACWRLASLGLQGCRLLRDVASLGALRALEEVRRTCTCTCPCAGSSSRHTWPARTPCCCAVLLTRAHPLLWRVAARREQVHRPRGSLASGRLRPAAAPPRHGLHEAAPRRRAGALRRATHRLLHWLREPAGCGATRRLRRAPHAPPRPVQRRARRIDAGPLPLALRAQPAVLGRGRRASEGGAARRV